MIIDEKVIMFPPPPPYLSSTLTLNPPPPFSPTALPPPKPTLTSLPPHILLQIVYSSFPQSPGVDQGKLERQRKTLFWLARSLRLVNRAFYIACMHVLRSTYLPLYQSLIRPPYSSDPFPSTSPSPPTSISTPTSPLQTIQRETPILDRFIALKVREDVFVDESELHLEREDMFRDLFDLSQPRSRLEDLVRTYGVRQGVITLAPPGQHVPSSSSSSSHSSSSSSSKSSTRTTTPTTSTPPTPSPRSPSSFFWSFKKPTQPIPQPPTPPKKIKPLPFSTLSVSFNIRKVGLLMSSEGGRKRTIVEVQRAGREEPLEVAAKRLVRELRVVLSG
ncbi:hypothetical protein K443DRAFT_679440 [Laccaria amethystina LaAM-08-1]|uniref:Uncharacterized protein n=1 Tax=Laccaria amethystina LaAM-08-1 TaxID=1095629 RepID=A0A0C9XQX2_9AGAR|nr:hypothetical protein K443DRAFT_679440 [Laccaria amethystina LaAM-08-1]